MFFKARVNGKTQAVSKPIINPKTYSGVRIYASKPARRGDYARALIRNFLTESLGDDAFIGVHVDKKLPANIDVFKLPKNWKRNIV